MHLFSCLFAYAWMAFWCMNSLATTHWHQLMSSSPLTHLQYWIWLQYENLIIFPGNFRWCSVIFGDIGWYSVHFQSKMFSLHYSTLLNQKRASMCLTNAYRIVWAICRRNKRQQKMVIDTCSMKLIRSHKFYLSIYGAMRKRCWAVQLSTHIATVCTDSSRVNLGSLSFKCPCVC